MEKTVLLSLAALAIDFLVCVIFGYQLYSKKPSETNKLFNLFVAFFFLFALFFMITPFYLPGVITNDPLILKVAFLTGFGILFAISVITLNIVFVGKKKLEEALVQVWSMVLSLLWFYFLFTLNPSKVDVLKWEFWGFSLYSLILALILVGSPFVVAAVVFAAKAIKDKAARNRYLLLSAGFLLIIVGGPLHQFSKIGSLFLVADVVTALGFTSLFLSLLMKEKVEV